jgi:hypothetical protein
VMFATLSPFPRRKLVRVAFNRMNDSDAEK